MYFLVLNFDHSILDLSTIRILMVSCTSDLFYTPWESRGWFYTIANRNGLSFWTLYTGIFHPGI